MVRVKIKTRLTNNLQEDIIFEGNGVYDKINENLTYYENGVYVTIKKDGLETSMERVHPDYNIILRFKEREKIRTDYELKKMKSTLDLETSTEELTYNRNELHIVYLLGLNGQDMGKFDFLLSFEEVNMDIKLELKKLVEKSLFELNINNIDVLIETPKDKMNGDFATNIAMQLSKQLGKNPKEVAEQIINNIEINDYILDTKIAGPGFINFYINKNYLLDTINDVLTSGDDYGRSNIGSKQKIDVEFASVNPTGTLHLGHARGSSYGDNLCRILDYAGFDVTREYYINDGGNQINNLGISIKERYRGLCGLEEHMPEDGYFGKEVIDIAKKLYDEYEDKLLSQDVEYFKEIGLKELLDGIKRDLLNFRVYFDVWTSERSVREKGRIEECLNKLKELDKVYEQEGALWLKSNLYGDEKDHVLVKNNGEYAYLTPDIAYHLDKIDRGYDKLIDVFGADHHGYVPRLKASIEALGYDKDILEVKLIQMVRLLKGNEEIKMSKRTGNVVTVNDLIEEVGVDATRYFFAMRNVDTQMDFDIELATKKSNENPVYYVQYAHARICSILREKVAFEEGITNFETINSEYAYNILAKLQEFKEVVEQSALKRLPHLITNYVYELANLFHIYYANEKVLSNDLRYTSERLLLIKAVKTVIKNALSLIGVEALEKM